MSSKKLLFGGERLVSYTEKVNLDASNASSYSGSGSTWYDLSGNSINGTLVGSPVFNATAPKTFQFTSAGSKYVNLGAVLNYTTQDFSFLMWIKVDSLSTNIGGQGPIILGNGAYQSNGYYCQVRTDGGFFFSTNQSGVQQTTSSAASQISTGVWYSIGISRKGNSVKIYKNGVNVTTTSGTHVNPTTTGANFLLNGYAAGIYGNTQISKFLVTEKKLPAANFLKYFNDTKAYYGY